ncbi:hypothetical protein ACI65C_011126, partial [Semiaphis heraclei]
MQTVNIKNLNKSYLKKPFIIKGRVRYLKVAPNRSSIGSHLNAIVFDKSSEIEIVAFKNCEDIAKLLKIYNVVTIEHGILKEVKKGYKKTKHKYLIILESISIITIINNNEENTDDLPIRKYTSAAELNTVIAGMIIDFPVVVLPDQRLSTPIITQPNKNSTIELPKQRLMSSSITQSYKRDESIDQKPSTSCSSPSNKTLLLTGKSQDFESEEGSSKMLKIADLEQESFCDERFVNMVLNFMKNINNNKNCTLHEFRGVELNKQEVKNESVDLNNMSDQNLKHVNFCATNHFSSSYNALNTMRRKNEYCDVQFVIGGIKISAHKAILSSHSNYFNDMFTGNFKDSKLLDIKNAEVTPSSFELLIDFLYTSQITINDYNVQELLIASHFLMLNDVEKECLKYLEKHIDIGNFMTLKRIADMNKLKDLHDLFFSFVLNNY